MRSVRRRSGKGDCSGRFDALKLCDNKLLVVLEPSGNAYPCFNGRYHVRGLSALPRRLGITVLA